MLTFDEAGLGDVEIVDVTILSSEQLQSGTANDEPNHVFEVRLPTGQQGWVAGPHGVSACAIGDWLQSVGDLADNRETAISQGCE